MTELDKELQLVMGELNIDELIEALLEVQRKPPAFAMAACSDAVLAFETLIKRHTNLDEDDIANACGAFGISLFNAATTQSAEAVYE